MSDRITSNASPRARSNPSSPLAAALHGVAGAAQHPRPCFRARRDRRRYEDARHRSDRTLTGCQGRQPRVGRRSRPKFTANPGRYCEREVVDRAVPGGSHRDGAVLRQPPAPSGSTCVLPIAPPPRFASESSSTRRKQPVTFRSKTTSRPRCSASSHPRLAMKRSSNPCSRCKRSSAGPMRWRTSGGTRAKVSTCALRRIANSTSPADCARPDGLERRQRRFDRLQFWCFSCRSRAPAEDSSRRLRGPDEHGGTGGADPARPYLRELDDDGPASDAHVAWRYEASAEAVRQALNANPRTQVGRRLRGLAVLTEIRRDARKRSRWTGTSKRVVRAKD